MLMTLKWMISLSEAFLAGVRFCMHSKGYQHNTSIYSVLEFKKQTFRKILLMSDEETAVFREIKKTELLVPHYDYGPSTIRC